MRHRDTPVPIRTNLKDYKKQCVIIFIGWRALCPFAGLVLTGFGEWADEQFVETKPKRSNATVALCPAYGEKPRFEPQVRNGCRHRRYQQQRGAFAVSVSCSPWNHAAVGCAQRRPNHPCPSGHIAEEWKTGISREGGAVDSKRQLLASQIPAGRLESLSLIEIGE